MIARSPRVVAALMSNESAKPLQTDSGPENSRENGLKGCVDNNLQDLTVPPLIGCCRWNRNQYFPHYAVFCIIPPGTRHFNFRCLFYVLWRFSIYDLLGQVIPQMFRTSPSLVGVFQMLGKWWNP